MLDFKKIKQEVEKHLKTMFDKRDTLYLVNVDKDEMWNRYLDAIPPQMNPIYRTNREYDCSTCRHFIKEVGNVVAIKDGVLESVWDIQMDDKIWNAVCAEMSAYIKDSRPIQSVFAKTEPSYGCNYDFERTESGEQIRYDHFFVKIPDKFYVNKFDIGTYMGEFSNTKIAFSNSLEQITLDSLYTVLELIKQDSIYRGVEYQKAVEGFIQFKKKYDALTTDAEKNYFVWENIKTPVSVARIKNTAIGTLLLDISSGTELDEAVRKYEAVVAPQNYKRSKPIFTKRMLEDAQKKITELGYLDSLRRRFARADDISVRDILFINRDTAKRVADANDIFASMAKDVKTSAKKFSKVEEIGIEDFIANVLPTATEVFAYVESKHEQNFVSLIAPVVAESKTMFKWNNNFSWAYSGNVTDSVIKRNVKSAGGKVDGVLRFSIQWNDDPTGWNKNDEDAHCIEPKGGTHIYYGHKLSRTGGNLDIDIINPSKGVPAVENITWPDLSRMPIGTYQFFVNTYTGRGGHGGFRAEIEYNGEIRQYNYTRDTRGGADVKVADVTLDKNGQFSIKEYLSSDLSSKDIWGVTTNDFVPVSVICLSPNYWGENPSGNKHYFFMLKDCVNPEAPNGFYNEYLNAELYPAHRKVMEAMGTKVHVEDCDDQLSGLGFSTTKRAELVVKVCGATERTMKIKF